MRNNKTNTVLSLDTIDESAILTYSVSAHVSPYDPGSRDGSPDTWEAPSGGEIEDLEIIGAGGVKVSEAELIALHGPYAVARAEEAIFEARQVARQDERY